MRASCGRAVVYAACSPIGTTVLSPSLPPFRKIITNWFDGLAASATAASNARVQSIREAA